MELGLLGPLEVCDGGRRLPLGGAKQRALLADLLIHANEVVSADRLVDDLWGDTAGYGGQRAADVRGAAAEGARAWAAVRHARPGSADRRARGTC